LDLTEAFCDRVVENMSNPCKPGPVGRLAGPSAALLLATFLIAPVQGVEAASPAGSSIEGLPARAGAQSLGAGSKPGLAVDAAGTAYVVWNGPENPSPLRFCKMPRGALGCDGGLTTTIATLGNSLSRPFVVVSGQRIVVLSYRYPQSGTEDFSGNYAYTSMDGGATFGAGVKVGTVPFFEAVVGPGDTVSGVTDALSFGMVFQNVPLGGGSAVTSAVLSADHPYTGAVGLVDAATPLAVFTAGDHKAQLKRYGGVGSLNEVASWSVPGEVGYAAYPKLAGGPTGLFLLAGAASGDNVVREYNGKGYVSLGDGDPVNHHLFQDAVGRVHAVVQRADAAGLHLDYWVSDHVDEWRSMTVAFQDPGVEGAFNDPRVATAADHVGVAVWGTSSTQEIRMVAVGPDVAKPKPGLKLKGDAKSSPNSIVVTAKGKLKLPDGVAKAKGCSGQVDLTVKQGSKVLAAKEVDVSNNCTFKYSKGIKDGKVGNADKVAIVAKFTGNRPLAVATKTDKVNVPG
jgi:hypothetical protein